MGRPRAFDWDEASRLYAQLGTYSAVARALGVSSVSVRRALNPIEQARCSRRQKTLKPWRVPCVGGCGGFATWQRDDLCMKCSALARSESVRPDTLRCSTCRLWLPDDSFPRRASSVSRRGRHFQCTPCGNVARRDYRRSHPEQAKRENEQRSARRRAHHPV